MTARFVHPHTCELCDRIIYPANYGTPYCPFRRFDSYYDDYGAIHQERCDQYLEHGIHVLWAFFDLFTKQLSPLGKMALSYSRASFYRAVIVRLSATEHWPWKIGVCLDPLFENWERWLNGLTRKRLDK